MNNAFRRAVRTLLQLIAAGGLTALVDQLAHGLTLPAATTVLVGWGVVVTYVQNLLENLGKIPTILPPKAPVPAAAVPASAAAVASASGPLMPAPPSSGTSIKP